MLYHGSFLLSLALIYVPLALPKGPSFLASRDPTDLGWGGMVLAATALAIAARTISNDDAEITVMADTAAGESGLPQLLDEKKKTVEGKRCG